MAKLQLCTLVLLAVSAPACRGPAAAKPAVPPQHDTLHVPPVGPSVTVRLGGETKEVELAGVPREPGSHSVPVVAVWRAAWPAAELTGLKFDFVGSDGFRPMMRSRCPRLLTADEMTHLTLSVVTHDISVDDGLSLAGCYKVHATVRIEASH